MGNEQKSLEPATLATSCRQRVLACFFGDTGRKAAYWVQRPETAISYSRKEIIRQNNFQNGTIKMAGDLYLPEGFNEGKKYPAIVCAHPSGGVKKRSIIEYRRRVGSPVS
jgi:hypothetical protein